jgi:hypothetical protein
MKKNPRHESRQIENLLIKAEKVVDNLKNQRLREIAFERLLDNILPVEDHSRFHEVIRQRSPRKPSKSPELKIDQRIWSQMSSNY